MKHSQTYMYTYIYSSTYTMNKKTYTYLNHLTYFKAIEICVFWQQLIVAELQNTHMNDQYIPRGFAKLDYLNPLHSNYHDVMAMYGESLVGAIWSFRRAPYGAIAWTYHISPSVPIPSVCADDGLHLSREPHPGSRLIAQFYFVISDKAFNETIQVT